MTVSDERTHTEFLRQREAGGVVLGNRLGVEQLDAGHNLGEGSEPQRLIRSLFVLPRQVDRVVSAIEGFVGATGHSVRLGQPTDANGVTQSHRAYGVPDLDRLFQQGQTFRQAAR